MAPCLVLVVASFIQLIILADASIDCVSVKSSLKDGYLGTAVATCSNIHRTMVSCGFETSADADNTFGGSWITYGANTKCNARNIFGNGVYAHARCCNFNQTVACQSYDGAAVSSDDQISSISCDADNPLMLGCTGYQSGTGGGGFDGMYPGTAINDLPQNKKVDRFGFPSNPTLFEMKNSCNAQSSQSSETAANINCCSGDIGLDCKLVYGNPMFEENLSCSSGYTMMACMIMICSAWYIGSDDTCNVRSATGRTAYASAICCTKEIEKHTQNPSVSPTKVPTTSSLAPTTSPPTFPPTFSSSAPTNIPSLYPTRSPTLNPISKEPSVTPSANPTILPSNVHSDSPTKIPSINPTQEPTVMPSKSPTAGPTGAPSMINFPTTSEPTLDSQSVAETYSNMMFTCLYNDESTTYYTIYISLSMYADLMIDSILEAVQSVTFHSSNYDDGDVWQYADWTRSGIFDFKICSLFDGVLINECAEIESIQQNTNANAQYSAIGTFGIIADRSIESYKKYLIDAMMNDNFVTIFESNMNNKLNEKINANGQNRRRLLQQTVNNFDAVSVEVIDWLSDRQNAQNNENESRNSLIIVIVVVLSVVFLCIVIIMFVFILRKISKNRVEEINKSVSKKVELATEVNKDNGQLEEPFVEEDNEKHSDILAVDHEEDNDDDLVNSINKLKVTNGIDDDDHVIVNAVNKTYGKDEEGDIDGDVVDTINETFDDASDEREGIIALPNGTIQ